MVLFDTDADAYTIPNARGGAVSDQAAANARARAVTFDMCTRTHLDSSTV